MKNLIYIFCLFLLFTGNIYSTTINFGKIEGWTVADTIDQYDSSNLWEYINGAADMFYTYGFQNLHSYGMSSGDIEIVVDVYNMGTQLNAYGMYKTERGEPKEKLEIGVEAVITSPNQCLMLKNIYYVKVNVYEGQLTTELSKNLLHSISGILPGSNEFPVEFELLPAENKIKDTEHFAKEGYLGLSELTNCLYADYKIEDSEFQYFVVLPESGENYDVIWNKLAEKWKKSKSADVSILFRKIPYQGLVGIIKTEKGIFGVTDSVTEVELIKRLEKTAQ